MKIQPDSVKLDSALTMAADPISDVYDANFRI